MELNVQVQIIKTLAEDVRSLLPKYGEADLTVQIETIAELQMVAIAMQKTVFKPNLLMNYHWFMYKIAGIKITVKTPTPEEVIEKQKYEYNGN